MKRTRFEFEPEKCPLCGSYKIGKVILQYHDFGGIQAEEKKMCRGCHATFSGKDMQVETVPYNLSLPEA